MQRIVGGDGAFGTEIKIESFSDKIRYALMIPKHTDTLCSRHSLPGISMRAARFADILVNGSAIKG